MANEISWRQPARSVRPITTRDDSSYHVTLSPSVGLRSSNPIASGAIVTNPRCASSAA